MSIVEMKVPTIGESITEVTLSQWLVADGDMVELDQPICEFESDKATLEFPAEASGKVTLVAAEGDDLEIGALVAKIDTSVSAPVATPEKTATQEPAHQPIAKEEVKSTAPSNTYASGHPSPSAAKILREKGLTGSEVKGTGKDGRITKEDALNAQKATKPETTEASLTNTSTPSFSRGSTPKKMSRMRRTIAKRLLSAKNSTAMLTTFNEVDMTEIFKLRKKYQEQFVAKHGIKLGFMSLFSKACAQVLMEMPDVNAYMDGDHLIYHDYVDISVAISTETGLVVPPIRNVESLDFHEVELAIKGLSEKARSGKLTLEEMTGGTFTISNGGVFGSMMSTPILNEPQSAILGMHNIIQRPVAINGQVEVRPMMYLALSYDHRVIDGRSSVTFLVKVKQLLEDPVTLLMGI